MKTAHIWSVCFILCFHPSLSPPSLLIILHVSQRCAQPFRAVGSRALLILPPSPPLSASCYTVSSDWFRAQNPDQTWIIPYPAVSKGVTPGYGPIVKLNLGWTLPWVSAAASLYHPGTCASHLKKVRRLNLTLQTGDRDRERGGEGEREKGAWISQKHFRVRVDTLLLKVREQKNKKILFRF